MTERSKYQRTPEQLEEKAVKFWPQELAQIEADLSVLPLLLETQDQFLSIIGIEPKDLDSLFSIIELATLPANLFVRHLMVLSDMGGESLERISSEYEMLFPFGELRYTWRGQSCVYPFRALPTNLDNESLQVNGRLLPKEYPLSNKQRDAIAIMLFGSAYSSDQSKTASILSRGEIGDYLGKPNKLKPFVKQRYLWVSRQTGGAKSNLMGHIAQTYVADYLRNNLDVPGISFYKSSRLPNVSHTDKETGRNTSFDLVLTNGQKYVAVEVAFQVTTNSVIERKAGQAQSRFGQINQAGHKIAYVIDGSGYFKRKTALKVICDHSHCTVAYSTNELDQLCDFIREELGS